MYLVRVFSACRIESSTHRPNVGLFLLNWPLPPTFGPCVLGFSKDKSERGTEQAFLATKVNQLELLMVSIPRLKFENNYQFCLSNCQMQTYSVTVRTKTHNTGERKSGEEEVWSHNIQTHRTVIGRPIYSSQQSNFLAFQEGKSWERIQIRKLVLVDEHFTVFETYHFIITCDELYQAMFTKGKMLCLKMNSRHGNFLHNQINPAGTSVTLYLLYLCDPYAT